MTCTVIGSFVSPYVRKVLAACELKGVAYAVDPITPFFGNDDFGKLSPLRRIPVLIDGDNVFNDSSIICAWLDETHPEPALYPRDPAERARARWIEEYADSRLGDLIVWGLFYQQFVRRLVWGEEPDRDRVAQVLDHDLPVALDYLETQCPQDGWLFGTVGVADLAVASFFRNALYVGHAIDPGRWPRTAGLVARTFAHPVMEKLFAWEKVQLSAEIKNRRQALLDAGAPLTETTYGSREPRRGLMPL